MFDITALGEILIDFTYQGKNEDGQKLFAQNPGGAPANALTAAELALAQRDYPAAAGGFFRYAELEPVPSDAMRALYLAMLAGCFGGSQEDVDRALKLLDEKGGIADPEDCLFSLTPIDVLFDESSSSTGYNYTNYYYYLYYGYFPSSSSSASSPIEVLPAMERPSIVKLDLENANLRLYYSRLFENN